MNFDGTVDNNTIRSIQKYNNFDKAPGILSNPLGCFHSGSRDQEEQLKAEELATFWATDQLRSHKDALGKMFWVRRTPAISGPDSGYFYINLLLFGFWLHTKLGFVPFSFQTIILMIVRQNTKTSYIISFQLSIGLERIKMTYMTIRFII